MKGLLVAPDIRLPKADEAAWELQRLGLDIYPLTGRVTEAHLAEHCTPERGHEFVVFLTHGTARGVYLAGSPGDEADAALLPLEAVAAYMQAAATVRLVVLAVCHGHNVAKEIFYRTGATVVYGDDALMADKAFTLFATFFRRLQSAGLGEAVKVADTLGLYFYPRTVKTSQDVGSLIQSLSAQLTGRMGLLEQNVDAHYRRTDERIGSLETRMTEVEDGLLEVSAAQPRRRAWARAHTARVALAAAALAFGVLLLHDRLAAAVALNGASTALLLVGLAAAAALLLAGVDGGGS